MSDEYTIEDVLKRIPEWGMTPDDASDDPDEDPVRIEEDEIVLDAVLVVRTKRIATLEQGRSASYMYTTKGTDMETVIGMLQRLLWEQQGHIFRAE